MKFFIIAGEASADLHGAKLVEAIRSSKVIQFKSSKSPSETTLKDSGTLELWNFGTLSFVGLGGDKMQAAGVTLLQHYREMAYMGVVAVLKNLGKVRRNFRIAKEGLLREKPDRLILIDYPSFNLKIAKFCRKHLPDTKIYYYIPPKVWAWKTYRVHQIARLCDAILAIFPFEVDFYAKYGYKAIYVGNPTANEVKEFQSLEVPKSYTVDAKRMDYGTMEQRNTETSNVIALLPGSRRHEIEKCLPKMLRAASQFHDYQIIIAAAPAIESSVYDRIIQDVSREDAKTRSGKPLSTIHGFADRENYQLSTNTYSLLRSASAAIVNSGTATLEAALLDCPQVAVYHVAAGRLLGLLRPLMFKIPHFTLVNILAGKEVIKELIAYLFTEDNIKKELSLLLTDEPYRQQMLDNYAQIKAILTDKNAPQEAAKIIITH